MKNPKECLLYCTKEAGVIVQFNMDYQAETLARGTHRKILGKRLQTEKLEDLVEENPELMWGLKRLRQDC